MRNTIALPALAAALLLGACAGDITVPDYNNPSIDDLQNSPTRSTVAAAATGLLVGGRTEFDDRNGYVSLLGIIGRESYNFDGADPRFVTEMLEGQLNPSSPAFGGNLWSERYRNIRTGMELLDALDKEIVGMTDAHKEGVRGFVKTMQAHELLLLANTRHRNGIVVDVPADPLATPGPLVGPAEALSAISQRLDEAAAHLQNGGGDFSFPLSSGFADFASPGQFLRFNRALKGRVEVYRGQYASALTALSQSFLDTGAPLTLGAYHSFGTGAGDAVNELFDPGESPDILAHPSLVTQATAGDLRLAKIRELPASQTTRGITTKYAFDIYTSLGSPIPIIRNEELILLRAEARWFTGDKGGAMADLNTVRRAAGLVSIASIPASDAEFVTALLRERRYSLLFEGGHRWIDHRRFGRLDELPLDLPNHVRNSAFPIPEQECLARDIEGRCDLAG